MITCKDCYLCLFKCRYLFPIQKDGKPAFAKVSKQNTVAFSKKKKSTYSELESILKIEGSDYIHFHKCGEIKAKLLPTEHDNTEILEWAEIPTEDFELVIEEPSDIASEQSSSIAELNDWAKMDGYGSSGFRDQFTSIAVFAPPVNGMEELLNLRPLADDFPAELCSMKEVDTAIMHSLHHHSEQSWIKYVYTPLLEFKNKTNIGYFSFEKKDYKSLFKNNWRDIKIQLSKKVGTHLKHPCPDVVMLYNSENVTM